MINTLKNLTKDFKIFESEDMTQDESKQVETDVINKLDRSVKFDEIDSVTFGLETDDGKVVKVYVNAEQADDFEKALAKKLGEVDDIEEVLNELSKEYEIVDVEWPDEDDDKDESEEDKEDDGSDSLDPKVYGAKTGESEMEDNGDKQFPSESLNYGENLTLTLMESSGSIESRFTSATQLMIYHAIIDLGVPEIALARNPYRAAIIKGIKDTAEIVAQNGGMKNSIKSFIKNSIDFEQKAKENSIEAKEKVKAPDVKTIKDTKPDDFKESVKVPEIKVMINEDKIDWSFNIKKDELNITSPGLSMILDSEEMEKLIKGVSNHAIVVVRDESETPVKKFVFSPRGHSIIVKAIGTQEGYMMTSKDVESLLDVINSK